MEEPLDILGDMIPSELHECSSECSLEKSMQKEDTGEERQQECTARDKVSVSANPSLGGSSRTRKEDGTEAVGGSAQSLAGAVVQGGG